MHEFEQNIKNGAIAIQKSRRHRGNGICKAGGFGNSNALKKGMASIKSGIGHYQGGVGPMNLNLMQQ